MKRLAISCVVLSLSFVALPVCAQDMPAPYKQVLDTLGKTGVQGRRAEGQHPAKRPVGDRCERANAHGVRIWWLGGDDQGQAGMDVMC